MQVIANPLRGRGIPSLRHLSGRIADDSSKARELFELCPVKSGSPLIDSPGLAHRAGCESFTLKDETNRMGLGSFKALGAIHAIARLAVDRLGSHEVRENLSSALSDTVFVCASAGNHGLSVAAGSRLFGARAVVYISETVSETFAERLRAKGAVVVRAGATYEASMRAAARDALEKGWVHLTDSSWAGYYELPLSVMEGYLISGQEVIDAIVDVPTHVFFQAGVGGFAASLTALFRKKWGSGPMIVVVEPDSARCITDSVLAGEPVLSPGPVSSMGRLDCKEGSHLALACLSTETDYFVTIEDAVAERAVQIVGESGVKSTPSGVAGVAAALAARDELGLSASSRCLAFVTEGSFE